MPVWGGKWHEVATDTGTAADTHALLASRVHSPPVHLFVLEDLYEGKGEFLGRGATCVDLSSFTTSSQRCQSHSNALSPVLLSYMGIFPAASAV